MSNGTPVKKKPWCFNMNKWTAISAIVVLVFAVIGAWYTVDCLNIKYFGDTVFAKDADLKESDEKTDKDLNKLREQLKLEQQIRKANRKLTDMRADLRANLLFIEQVRAQYPVKDDIPGYSQFAPKGLFKEYRRAKKDRDRLEQDIASPSEEGQG
jgi:hypothetical protein